MGVETDQIDFVVQVHAATAEDALQDLRIEKEGGAQVEVEPVLRNRRGSPPHLPLLLENLDIETGLGQEHGVGQAARPCTYDNDLLGSASSSLSAPTPHDAHLRLIEWALAVCSRHSRIDVVNVYAGAWFPTEHDFDAFYY